MGWPSLEPQDVGHVESYHGGVAAEDLVGVVVDAWIEPAKYDNDPPLTMRLRYDGGRIVSVATCSCCGLSIQRVARVTEL